MTGFGLMTYQFPFFLKFGLNLGVNLETDYRLIAVPLLSLGNVCLTNKTESHAVFPSSTGKRLRSCVGNKVDRMELDGPTVNSVRDKLHILIL